MPIFFFCSSSWDFFVNFSYKNRKKLFSTAHTKISDMLWPWKEQCRCFLKKWEREFHSLVYDHGIEQSFGNFTPLFLLEKNYIHEFYNQNTFIYVRHLEMETEMPVPWYLMDSLGLCPLPHKLYQKKISGIIAVSLQWYWL